MSGPQTSLQCSIEFDSLFEPLLDSEEAAQLLRIHPKTLQRMARRGGIPSVQIGRLWHLRRSQLNAWVEDSRAWLRRMQVKNSRLLPATVKSRLAGPKLKSISFCIGRVGKSSVKFRVPSVCNAGKQTNREQQDAHGSSAIISTGKRKGRRLRPLNVPYCSPVIWGDSS